MFLDRMDRQFAFLREIDKLKTITRQTYLSDGTRKENDAEHSWHLAMLTLLLGEYANESIDPLKTMAMVLCHDLVEIYAGDTFAYDEEGKKTQAAREENAARRLYPLLPADQAARLYDLWQEFEEGETPEAKFAHAMDNLQPLMLADAAGGKGWVEHHTTLSQVLGRNASTSAGSQTLWAYAEEHFLAPHLARGHLRDDTRASGASPEDFT